jgi:replication initiation and membrane attachment protein
MSKLNLSDFYKINKVSEVTDLDKKTLTLLYEPFIGHVSLSLYLTLLELSPLGENKEHQLSFLAKQVDITINDLDLAFKRLDATGLIRRYVQKDDEYNHYRIDLYAPLDPHNFFDDYLFTTLLRKYVGDEQFLELQSLFTLSTAANGENEITKSFLDVYGASINEDDYIEQLPNFSSGRKSAELEFSFDIEKFQNYLQKKYHISKDSLDAKQLNKIQRIATLHHFNEQKMASEVSHIYDPNAHKGTNIDFPTLIDNLRTQHLFDKLHKNTGKTKIFPKILKGDSNNVELSNMMETMDPVDFLCSLLNVDELPKVNANLIENLSTKYYLSNAAINALLFWVSINNNGNIYSNYVEAFAIPIKSADLYHASDVLDFLIKNKEEMDERKIEDMNKKRYANNRLQNSQKKPQVSEELEENDDDEEIDLDELKRQLKATGKNKK